MLINGEHCLYIDHGEPHDDSGRAMIYIQVSDDVGHLHVTGHWLFSYLGKCEKCS